MAESDRAQNVATKIASLKKAGKADEARAKWELALAVFDSNNDGKIDDKDTRPSKWRYGLGIDSASGLDTRDEVEKLLGLKGYRSDEDISTVLQQIRKASGQAPAPREPGEAPVTPDSELKDHLKAYASARANAARPGEVRMKAKALLSKFFDLDGNGTITRSEVRESTIQLNHWERLSSGLPGAPSPEDIRPLEELLGMRDTKGNKIRSTLRDVAEKLKSNGLDVTDDDATNPRNAPRVKPPPQRGRQ